MKGGQPRVWMARAYWTVVVDLKAPMTSPKVGTTLGVAPTIRPASFRLSVEIPKANRAAVPHRRDPYLPNASSSPNPIVSPPSRSESSSRGQE